MKSSRLRVLVPLTVLASLVATGEASAGNPPEFSKCAWPVMMSPEGLGNYLGGPDGQARYWLTPFHGKYQAMQINGHFPACPLLFHRRLQRRGEHVAGEHGPSSL
jgi:hypothetical protein